MAALLALLALGLPASAQQSIQFSKPVNQDPAVPANAFLQGNRSAPTTFNAPSSLFNNPGATADFDVLPGGPQPVILGARSEQWQRALEDRKNWTLMTPEKILGIPTPESILNIADPNDDPKLSAEERFLQRQDRQARMAATNNAIRSPDFLFERDNGLDDSPFRDQNDSRRTSGSSHGSDPAISGPLGSFKPFSGRDPQAAAEANQASSIWTSPFGTPLTTPKQTPEQLAGMERFRSLFDAPAQSPDKPTRAIYSSGAVTAPDPNMQALPAFNPAGRSFTPLASDIARPTGLTPLNGLTGPRPAPPKKTPLVQPPPWISESPQSSAFPQRQF